MQYDERLRVPLRWWVQGTVFVVMVWVAFIVALPAPLAWGGALLLAALVAGLLAGYGAARVRVHTNQFQAGRARIPTRLLDEPLALDEAAVRRRAGVEADARAYLLIRPYLKQAVQVRVVDPDDPTPYWLVSTRRPAQLVAALTRHVGHDATDPADGPPLG